MTPNQPGDDLGRAHKDRGTALLGKGKIDAALKEFELAVLAQPGDVVARRKVAELCARLGRISDAVAAYQHLAGRFAAEGRLVQAIAVCKVILQLDAKHEETQRTLSRLYSKRTEPGGKRPTDRPLPGSPMLSNPDSTGELALDTSEYDPTRSGEREAMPATMAGAIEFSDSGAVRMLPKPLPALPGLQGVSSASPRSSEGAPEQRAQASQAPSPQVPQAPSTQAPSEPPAATHEVEIVVGELPQTPLFSELPAPIMQALLETLIMVPYEPGQEILVEGETGRSLFVLASGSVEVVRTLPSGERKVVDTMQAGSFFGEIGLVADVPRLATVVAAEECVVLEVTREHVRELSKRFPVLPELVRTFYKERLLANLIRSSPIFAPLTASERRAVADKFVVLDVGAGEVLLKQGEGARGLFLLLRGRCAVSYRDQQGADHDLPEMAEGAVMGEISLVNDSPVTATVTARTQSVLLQLDPATFAARVFANPKTRELILKLSNERQARTDAIDAAAPGPELL